MTLYDLTAEYLQLLEMAEDPDVSPEALDDTIEAIGGEIDDKADGYGKVIKELTARSEAVKKEADRLLGMRWRIESSIARLKGAMQSAMVATGKRDIRTDLFHFWIQKNPASVVIDDPDAVPEKYLIAQPPKIDKRAIKEAIERGDNCSAFARIEQGEGVRFK